MELVAGAAQARLPEEVAALLAERAGGNPFFLEEALRDLVEGGALRPTNGSFELAIDLPRIDVPTIVQEALQARLDRLAPETRDLISVASVVGRNFTMPLLEQLLPGVRLTPQLGELQRLDLVVEERRRPVIEYRFRHGLTQEVAYASLPTTRRQELHRRAALVLEQLHSDSADEIAGLLAHHNAEGGEAREAARWSERAGDAARAQYANDEAVSQYERAVLCYDEVGESAAARNVLFKVATGHLVAFEFGRAQAAYAAAFDRPEESLARLAEPTESISFPMIRQESMIPGFTYSALGWWVSQHVFRGLVRVDRDRTILPDLAERFSVSADGLAYTFRLRDHVLWDDGVPVTAHDFAWTGIGCDPKRRQRRSSSTRLSARTQPTTEHSSSN